MATSIATEQCMLGMQFLPLSTPWTNFKYFSDIVMDFMSRCVNGDNERTFEFALLIIELYKYLIGKNEYVMSKQILRSGTSIGANARPVK